MLERWIVRHWGALSIGCILTGIAVRLAYISRGYIGVGSEWAIIPMAFLAEYCGRRKS